MNSVKAAEGCRTPGRWRDPGHALTLGCF